MTPDEEANLRGQVEECPRLIRGPVRAQLERIERKLAAEEAEPAKPVEPDYERIYGVEEQVLARRPGYR